MSLLHSVREKFVRVHQLAGCGLLALVAGSGFGAHAIAQAALAEPSREATFTPIGLSAASSSASQAQSNVVYASMTEAPMRPQMASPMPKFDMNEAAQRYLGFVQEADRMATLPQMSQLAIAQALATTSNVSSKGISEGAGAYAAQVAASQPEFAAGLATLVNIMGREAVLTRLRNDPDQLLAMISGSQQASRKASGALEASEAKLARAQHVLGEAAYSVQSESWAQSVVDTQATLAAHRYAATLPVPQSDLMFASMTAPSSDTPLNKRYLLAASYQILGDNVAATEVLDKPLGRMCMNRVQLNVRQCIAASRFPYEHLFCLSQHSFGEALGCVKDAAK